MHFIDKGNKFDADIAFYSMNNKSCHVIVPVLTEQFKQTCKDHLLACCYCFVMSRNNFCYFSVRNRGSIIVWLRRHD